MHRLLGAVHEAAVQLSKLPVGDVTAALLQVLHGTGRDSGQAHGQGLPGCPHCLRMAREVLTVRRSRRKRMLGTR